ncbi:MAG: hypothetical protein AAF493_25305, partial [Pseudomonadota bacterium]
MRLWDVTSGQALKVFKGHTGPIFSVGFSPDGSRLASASSDHTMRLWSVTSGQALKVFKG